MERLFLVESDRTGLRAALVEDRRLRAIEIDRVGRVNRVGSVVSAKVIRTLQGLGTTIELPGNSQMLLNRGRSKNLLEPGETITVQVSRPPRGTKMGMATCAVSLAGRGAVHLPFESGITVSRRLQIDTEKRAGLESLAAGKPGGWIFRRSAGGICADDLATEIATLATEGQALLVAEPHLPGPDAFRRLASDYSEADRILAAGLAAQRSVESWCRDFAPSLTGRVEQAPPGLFDLHDLDSAIADLAESRVALSGGGSLVIELTEALTAIDVNAGAEPNSLAVDLAAAAEIARQLRLRHIGGIVVIDFISLSRPRDRDRLMDALRAAVADDPAQTYIVPMSPLGLVEMTRERRGPGLEFDLS
ncbi:MAG: ribonuclease [Rhodospirillales bacterium]|nr:ribonuclease [Rhodospirillales bacterium]